MEPLNMEFKGDIFIQRHEDQYNDLKEKIIELATVVNELSKALEELVDMQNDSDKN